MGKEDCLEDIRRRAYEIWRSEGCPEGRDHIHWLRAEAEFRDKFASAHASAPCSQGFHERPSDSTSVTVSARPKAEEIAKNRKPGRSSSRRSGH